MLTLQGLCSSKSTFYCDDSVAFLKTCARDHTRLDLVYLDSWDVDWPDPLASALHGLHEFLVLLPLLREGVLLLVDDTPQNRDVMRNVQPAHVEDFDRFMRLYGFAPGKGSLIKNFLVGNGLEKELAHDYQLLWEF